MLQRSKLNIRSFIPGLALVAAGVGVIQLTGCFGMGQNTPGSLQLTPSQMDSRLSFASSGPPPACPAYSPALGTLTPDGDFNGAPGPGAGQTYMAPNGIPKTKWTVIGRTVDLMQSSFPFAQGVCSVDLDGTPGAGGITHAPFTTMLHHRYTVSFWLSGNGGGPPTVKTMQVSAAGSSKTFTYDTSNGQDAQHGVYKQMTWRFKASSRSTVLAFRSLDPHGKTAEAGPVVTVISVTP